MPDVCELSGEMLLYTKKCFKELITTGKIKEIRPGDVWYKEREDFSENAIGTDMECHANTEFELLRGNPVFKGKILGGSLESIYYIFDVISFVY